MSELATKRKETELRRIESAICETELAVIERQDEIKRCEVQLAAQRKTRDDLQVELNKMKEGS